MTSQGFDARDAIPARGTPTSGKSIEHRAERDQARAGWITRWHGSLGDSRPQRVAQGWIHPRVLGVWVGHWVRPLSWFLSTGPFFQSTTYHSHGWMHGRNERHTFRDGTCFGTTSPVPRRARIAQEQNHVGREDESHGEDRRKAWSNTYDAFDEVQGRWKQARSGEPTARTTPNEPMKHATCPRKDVDTPSDGRGHLDRIPHAWKRGTSERRTESLDGDRGGKIPSTRRTRRYETIRTTDPQQRCCS